MADTDAVKEALDDLCSEAYYNGNAWSLVKSWRDTIESALASRPAGVDDEGLPPLPSPEFCAGDLEIGEPVYTAEQYRQGQRDAVAAYKRQQVALQQLADQAQELDMGYGAAPSHTTIKEK